MRSGRDGPLCPCPHHGLGALQPPRRLSRSRLTAFWSSKQKTLLKNLRPITAPVDGSTSRNTALIKSRAMLRTAGGRSAMTTFHRALCGASESHRSLKTWGHSSAGEKLVRIKKMVSLSSKAARTAWAALNGVLILRNYARTGPSPPVCQLLYFQYIIDNAVEPDRFLARQNGTKCAIVNLEGKTPSNGRREDPAALPPLLGRGMKPRPATKGATPPWNPLERFRVASHGAYEPLVNIHPFLNRG